MSNVIIEKNKIDILANAISNKSGEPVTMTLAEMVAAVDGIETGGGSTPTLQAKTYAVDSAGTETITADSGYDGLSEVEIEVPQADCGPSQSSYFTTENNVRKWVDIASTYAEAAGWVNEGGVGAAGVSTYNAVPSGTTVTPTTSAQTIGDRNYMMEGAVTVAAMPSGTAGTPTATKGTVSNHAVSVTPSVTNSAGYISGGTKTGTAVSVSASELVSGSQTLSDNGDYDVTNLASVTVAVSGGGGALTVGTKTTTLSAAASSISFTGLSGNPTSFVVTSSADQTTGGTKVVAVAWDGSDFNGMDVTTQAAADTGFSKSYSSGTLTITATSAQFQANEYKLVYTYGGSSSDIHTADVQVGSGATSITFTSLSGNPAYFSCVFKSDFSTSSGYQRVMDVVYDGTNTYGHAFDSEANAQTSWSHSYSGGSLTISSQGTNNGGYFHQPGYYQLTYAVDPNALNLQQKTNIGASTSSQTITADNGYDGLESVQINAVSQTNLTAANIKSGTTISISNGSTNLWSVTGTYTGGGGGSASIDTKTTTSSNRPTSLSFTSMLGQPKAFFLRCTSSMSRSSNSSYYYVATMRYNGTNTTGNCWRMSNGNWTNITSGYSYTYSGTTLTLSSTGTTTTSPGCFYPGNYELVYIY